MKEEKVLYKATICFLIKDGRILLALKTCKIGAGFLNGYGGGIELGETAVATAIRELKEETDKDDDKGVVALPADLEKIAIVDFNNIKSDGDSFVCRVHVYLVKDWKGEAKDTETMIDAQWYDVRNLPLDEMMPSDKVWLPIALSGRKIMAKATLGPFQQELIGEVEIEEVDTFPEE
jgi:8-oxo-dGTP pyrophosphatase MutT (NUDIX family)